MRAWNRDKIVDETNLTSEILKIKNQIDELNHLVFRLTETRKEDFKIKICYSTQYEEVEVRNDIFCKAIKEEIEFRRNILKEKIYKLNELFEKNN